MYSENSPYVLRIKTYVQELLDIGFLEDVMWDISPNEFRYNIHLANESAKKIKAAGDYRWIQFSAHHNLKSDHDLIDLVVLASDEEGKVSLQNYLTALRAKYEKTLLEAALIDDNKFDASKKKI
ncbi:hypothetical protein [Paraburkholderia tropica]|uniref:hypothetical protein n=1 Tax=Paraburkholderia tropica TaxID=92647 RepID=UPI003D2BAE59